MLLSWQFQFMQQLTCNSAASIGNDHLHFVIGLGYHSLYDYNLQLYYSKDLDDFKLMAVDIVAGIVRFHPILETA